MSSEIPREAAANESGSKGSLILAQRKCTETSLKEEGSRKGKMKALPSQPLKLSRESSFSCLSRKETRNVVSNTQEDDFDDKTTTQAAHGIKNSEIVT
ncbi:hypothetical protein RUM43_000115 [Polyplax serrata]|uniref:Uncharacterized protein n=1 Tax=Polyplax serrata TaxID=468196 RepID=A0AAN8SF18_POLSC